jgi:hypothetical protein
MNLDNLLKIFKSTYGYAPRFGQIKELARQCKFSNSHKFDPKTDICIRCGEGRNTMEINYGDK